MVEAVAVTREEVGTKANELIDALEKTVFSAQQGSVVLLAHLLVHAERQTELLEQIARQTAVEITDKGDDIEIMGIK